VNSDFAKAKNQSGNRLGIGESAYFLVQTTSKVMAIEDGKWSLADGSVVDTKYIFGNEIRDASRFVHLEDYSSQNDLNAFTEYLNNYIRDTKIAGESKNVKVGDEVYVIGACEIHPNKLPVDHLYIYPVTIKK
jgi:predicted lipoprotein